MSTRFQKILYRIVFNPDDAWWIFSWDLDQVNWCEVCKEHEEEHLALTPHEFIVEAIIRGGRKNNHYILTLVPQ